jgi:hypothetical protein
MRRFSAWLLEWAERLFLHSYGWVKREDGRYDPPDGYPNSADFAKGTGVATGKRTYVRSHAVNSQKQYVYNPRCGGTRVDPDLRKDKGYETL